jgi:tetratricopeptide (TPR) repeat protein
LACDPEHGDCLDMKAMCLTRMGRTDEATMTIGDSLQRNPNNAYSHANQGWSLLHANQPKQALTHFEEALRLEPNNEWARNGMVECLKARNPIYRLFLVYTLWMVGLSDSVRWLVLLGGFVLYRVADHLSFGYLEYALYLRPFVWAYVMFAITTWIAQPLFEALLIVHPRGRHALNNVQKRSATIGVALILLACGGVIAYFITGNAIGLMGAFAATMMCQNVHLALDVTDGDFSHWIIKVSGALLLLGVASIFLVGQDEVFGLTLWRYYIYGWIACFFLYAHFANRGF